MLAAPVDQRSASPGEDLIRDVEKEAAVERRANKKIILGAEAVMEVDPQYRPAKLDRSPARDFHARRKEVRKAMRDAYAWVVAAYAQAAEPTHIISSLPPPHTRFGGGVL